MGAEIFKTYELGDMTVNYVRHTGAKGIQLILFPSAKKELIKVRREFITGRAEVDHWAKVGGPQVAGFSRDSLLQLKIAEEPARDGFAGGISMFDSPTTEALEFVSQTISESKGETDIQTVLRHPLGLVCVHHLIYRDGMPGVELFSEVTNESGQLVSLELFSSFVLNGITPFDEGECIGRLKLHRFRSWWSAEGRLESRSIEELHLERAWTLTGARSERFGQVGSMPVRQFFPFVALEDTKADVVWAAKLAWAGSWQMEAVRRGDTLALTGGLADREFGHWLKKLVPGEALTSPRALVSCSAKGFDDVCERLIQMQETQIPVVSGEDKLPIIFNEWCSSWGSPTQANVLDVARKLKDTPVRYLVIDAGWAARTTGSERIPLGDWVVDQTKFPGGFKPTTKAVRELGFIPGLWFEFEVCNRSSEAWSQTEHLLHRDGRPIEAGRRRFRDLRDPWVQEHLAERVIGQLRDGGFGYLKVDYNDTLGLGCDHPESLGEGLRLQMIAVQEFFRKIQKELPDLVIENCSSGGHRLEPSMMTLSSMSSFSDAHEGQDIPIIAANLQRLIPACQNQIWAVLRKEDSVKRTVYSLTATCLGRMCISGSIKELSDEQMQLVKEGMAFYEAAAPVIKNGTSVFFGTPQGSYRDPQGWQAVIRYGKDAKSALVVVHNFDPPFFSQITLPLRSGNWRIDQAFACNGAAEVGANGLSLKLSDPFAGQAYLLAAD